ncbi:phosphonoacetaldehyde hydrolase [Motiliproteus coralliicola]|uniref:Phosphonoacetaldehyde hydrolase n=1 Tax=Motiliproteus coralliicola TaxID=2283196 RepID=A0A369WPJ0_9GAMM|nr:phosphonoacetaldehyde hydrolase [Motiliproteus coralliicola]RDE22486.1 phosphonoacetaldehyde hydrolase [Motiliproteus coralliicola]
MKPKREVTNPSLIQAVVFDWAGTVVDFGSLAPIDGFCQLFERNQVPITQAEARIPMGTEKRAHIAQLLAMPRIRDAWLSAYQTPPSEADIDRLYEAFIPIQIEAIERHAQLIPGTRETFDYLSHRKIPVGGNTGYSREMITGLVTSAAEAGYRPQSIVAASDVPRGRPHPDMLHKNLSDLAAESPYRCIKVDDTLPGIKEGLNAGCWTVAVALTGNEIGLDLADWNRLPDNEKELRREQAYRRLHDGGAHYVIDSVAELPGIVEAIERRLKVGERPQ